MLLHTIRVLDDIMRVHRRGVRHICMRRHAETGVDYLSVGALTHSSPILDVALDLAPRGEE